MAIRLRMTDEHWIALCAAETQAKKDDVYLDDGMHKALSDKFQKDFIKMGFMKE